MSSTTADAVVVGGGHNGLVAANILADEGWDVVVLEGMNEPGGAVRSAELTLPGCVHDVFSAFYPLAAASPVMRSLGLEDHGLEWRRAPVAVAHPLPDGTCPYVAEDPAETLAALEQLSPAEARAWERLFALWQTCGSDLLAALTKPFPPLMAGARIFLKLGPHETLRLARLAVLPLRRLMDEENAPHVALLLAGNALHADLTPELPLGTLFGWLLASLAQDVGFPVPAGGAGRLIDALVSRLRARGGEVRCGHWVTRVESKDGVATGVRCEDGSVFHARRAILADVPAPALYRNLIGFERLPPRTREDLDHFHLDDGTYKVDWLLREGIPWTAEPARRAGTVHVGDSLDDLSEMGLHLARRTIPDKPYLVVGQMNLADPSRSQPGTMTAWAYTHVPQRAVGDAAGVLKGTWDDDEAELFADRIEEVIETRAPGFKSRIVARHLLPPPRFTDINPALPMGALNGGTAQIHQQLVFRPLPGLARPRTPLRRLYLASASAHPGGGVHGAPGANAAKAALRAARLPRRLTLGAAGVALGAGIARARR